MIPFRLACLAVLVAAAEPAAAQIPYIDVHAHLHGVIGRGQADDYEGAARVALKSMDELGVRQMLILPPPFGDNQLHVYDAGPLLEVARRHPGRFAVIAGGGSLNPLIMEAVRTGKVTDDLHRRFVETAERLAASGVVGFGEMTAEHFSLGPTHPYEAAAPDHPLFLLLADIAARHDLPIDLHMEAIEREASLDSRYRSPPNPSRLSPNIAAFERLLAHNRKARLVWSHVGWDNTGQRTAGLTRRLLTTHPNLYVSVKMGPDSLPANRLLEKGRGLAPEWRALIEEFPDRFLIGTDQFFVAPASDKRFPRHPGTGRVLLDALPDDLARRIGLDNPLVVFPRLKK
jgi:hypothetical protein